MWTCSVRSATIRCRATVLQRGNSFVRGANVHVHPADLKLPHLKKVSAQAKAIAVDQVFRPARDIVEATVSDTVQDRFVAPKTSNIKRYVNNYRTAFRPKDHTYLDFEINMDFLQCEEFLTADLRVGEEDTWSSLQSTNLIFCDKQRNGTLMAPLRLCNPSWNQLAN